MIEEFLQELFVVFQQVKSFCFNEERIVSDFGKGEMEAIFHEQVRVTKNKITLLSFHFFVLILVWN